MTSGPAWKTGSGGSFGARPGSPNPLSGKRDSIGVLRQEQKGIFSAGADEEKLGLRVEAEKRSRSFYSMPTYQEFSRRADVDLQGASQLRVSNVPRSFENPEGWEPEDPSQAKRSHKLHAFTSESSWYVNSGNSSSVSGRRLPSSLHRSTRLEAQDDPKKSASKFSSRTSLQDSEADLSS
uniref:Uncharacterized protein n=1 Tax=Rhodosorus marinus TaxID=101924 RepID=A0A7S0G306_9RHOD|mmetsp:Transcript_18645/g.26998  ORF Transcript_18645/g.26998 Transcript_18645/m.26998 type:complete len:180 (+) Transcript_18645:54-593(+)